MKLAKLWQSLLALVFFDGSWLTLKLCFRWIVPQELTELTPIGSTRPRGSGKTSTTTSSAIEFEKRWYACDELNPYGGCSPPAISCKYNHICSACAYSSHGLFSHAKLILKVGFCWLPSGKVGSITGFPLFGFDSEDEQLLRLFVCVVFWLLFFSQFTSPFK